MADSRPEAKEALDKHVDIFRDTPVRFLGYANEVGEAFRSLVHVNFVRFTYLVASTYALSDASSKAIQVYQAPHAEDDKSHERRAVEMFIEAAIWQSLASVIIPGFTINRICWMSGHALRMFASKSISEKARNIAVTGIGLSAIPLIIKPIDRLTDKIMAEGIKLSTQLGIEHEYHHHESFHEFLSEQH